ncbi:MAG: TolC family protein [Sulfurimonas sp.]|nr:TolC family protein [Sulfurimonas sp.]
MKLKLFLVFFFTLNAYSQNLSEIIEALQKSNKTLSITQKTYSDIAKNEIFDTQEAPELGLSLSQADESTQDGLEYAVGISQKLAHPFASDSKTNATDALTKSIKQKTKHKLHILTLEVSSRYHSACTSKEMSDGADLLYKEQSSRFNQLQRAYDLGEISKKSLLFNKLDLAKLQQKVASHKRSYLTELSYLQESIDNLTINELSCNDLVEISRDIKLNSIQEHGEIKEITYQQSAAKSFYDVYNSSFKSLGYELLYEKELDKTRYTFGLSIPLGGATSQTQKQQAEYLFKNSSLVAEKEALTSEIINASKSLQLKIETLYDEYTLLNQEILPMSFELRGLSKSALSEGEGTIMEYLDATRSYSENLLEMLKIKKIYYYELFELYKRADLDLGKKL